MEVLTYPIAIRCEKNKQIINTLFFFRHVINFYLRKLTNEEIIEGKLSETKFAYKCLENIAKNKRYYIPSRINRGLLEIAGRIERTIKDRRELYSLLLEIEKDPENWDYKLLIEKNSVYKKSQYVENLKEQAINYLQNNNDGILPDDYLNLSKIPRLKNGIISYAPDDGQAIKFSVSDNKINVNLKVLRDDSRRMEYTGFAFGKPCVSSRLSFRKQDKPRKRSDWEWIDFSFNLPDIVEGQRRGVSADANLPLSSPDLRLGFVSGKLTPIIDLKVKVEERELKNSKYFLTVDWGLNKLVTICVFNSDGEQISPPFFLKCGAIQDKLFRIRTEIDSLKAKRDKLPKGSTLALWYNREVAKRWNKYRAIQKQLSHLASNVIVEIAKLYNCSKIYVEWLGSLKSRTLSRTLNWKINSQVRHKIYEKVEYKAKLAGILLKTINPAWTSQFCPKCGKRGYHVKASDRLNERQKSGGWFYCQECGYNADRDYVACQNIARKALYGDKLKCMSKAFVYNAKAISDKLFRQSISAMERLRDNLNGWKKVVFLRPVYLVTGTLRL